MSWFETFFKYDPIVYQRGTLAFSIESPAVVALLVIVCGAGAYLLFQSFRPAKGRASWGMVALRALTIAILIFILLGPVLNISTVLPQESYMAVVIDNSQSMQIADDGETRRADRLMAAIESSQFFPRLAEKFKLQLYRYDNEAERIDDVNRMTFNGTRTRTESALELLNQETVPFSGVVLMTDGVDNASEQMTEAVSRLQARGVPIYAVGVGEDAIDQDAELIDISQPRESLNEATVTADVRFRSQGLAGRRGTLQIRENGVLLQTEEVTLPRDGEVGEVSVDIAVRNEGSRVFEYTIEAPDDRIPENNVLSTLMEVKNDQPAVLYVEGEPRHEYDFMRRAVEDDPNLRLATLLRTSPNKFYRQGLEREDELTDGFPTTREELFAYQGLILGSVEATFFTQDQLEMIVDFVSERGGGFMMIGGRNAFSGGRYQNTPIADLLPVRLSNVDSDYVVGSLQVAVSDYGQTHPLMKLNPTGGETVAGWDELPSLTEFNRVIEAKVGAIVLATGDVDGSREEPILLAYQRYGTGRTMAFTTAGSWRWQMGMDHKDMTHELFWRQLLRWLVSDSPDPVMAYAERDSYVPDETIRLFAEISDASFERMNNADVFGRVIDPDGNSRSIRFEWTGLEDGTYQATVAGSVPGIYTLDVEASNAGELIGSYESTFQVRDRPVEFYSAGLDRRFLETVAEQSGGGGFYTLDELGDIPDDAVYVEGESSIIEQRELWDVPVLFMLLAATLGSEWFWRKKKGLA